MNISDIAAAVATRKCALFAGAGLTADSGGSTWDELVNSIKNKLTYTSPLKDNFQIMGDMCEKYGYEKVYELVKDKLKHAKIETPVSNLTGLPWFTVFTTNYDLALEKSLHKNQSLNVRIISTGKEFVLTGLQSEILCVKLMGSLDIPYGQPGSMVLDSGDLTVAMVERSKIFDILASHAANVSFLFIGYSFDDNLFFQILDKLIKEIGSPKNTYYAIFKEAPDEEKTYLLGRRNVEWIVADLDSFAKELSKQVALRNPDDLTLKRIPIGYDVVPINPTKIGSFLSVYNPVLFEDLEGDISAKMFFYGDTNSFKPFGNNWHFQRKEIKDVIDVVLNKKDGDKHSLIVKVEGRPGTGRTFIILAAVYELIKKHRAIAIKIPSYSVNPIPNPEEIEEFLEEIKRASEKNRIKGPERLVFWAEFTLDREYISQFKNLSAECKYPTSLIFEDVKHSQMSQSINQIIRKDETQTNYPVSIDADVDLSAEEKKDLAQYILDITRKHKFQEIEEDEVYTIIDEEKTFLPIIYRTIDPTKRSINRILQENFNSIPDPDTKTCISICALTKSLDLDMPIAVLRKALIKCVGKPLSYPDTFEIAVEKGNMFIKESIDSRTNYYFVSIYHSLVAKHIIEIIGQSKIEEYLLSIAQTVDLRSKIEADFISCLFIGKGVHWEERGTLRPLTEKGLCEALSDLKNRQPARPIIHHLARLKVKINPEDEEVIPLLEEALVDPIEHYALMERKQNVLTTLAKIKWEQNKKTLLDKPRSDPEIQEIIGILCEARENANDNIHSYVIHARILCDLCRNKDEDEKMKLINEAVDVINEGLSYCVYNLEGEQRLNYILTKSTSEIDPKRAKAIAKELLNIKKDGSGYYTLAIIEYYNNSDLEEATLFLEEAMNGDTYPPGVIPLYIEIFLQDDNPPYEILLGYVDQLSSDIRFRDNWKLAYHKAIIYTINGRYNDAVKYFKHSYRKSPKNLQRKVPIFWMENGRRKTHRGIIGLPLTRTEGYIRSHNISGWKDNIFFDPRSQDKKTMLKEGSFVKFEIGFSPRGPRAFDVRIE
ncbi:hypothetical protein BEH94_06660 [Candidatus Altiarchaeales archaeon WOR_SM1_SCG]|nr:hypothetical protein BEH94_06660 [Candidatus Altiarchaeales archaeon WOR_SM1_SCG]